MTGTFNRTVSLVASALAGAAFVYFMLPGRTARYSKTVTSDIASPPAQIQRVPPSVLRNDATDKLLLSVLSEYGIDIDQVRRGVYKLTGTQWQNNPMRPLLEFQLPRNQDESKFWAQLETRLIQDNFSLAAPKSARQGKRAALRAVIMNDSPEVILRAFPTGPFVTVIVDGVGHEPALLESLMNLDPDVTFSIDSDSAFAHIVSRSLDDAQRELIAGVALSSPILSDGTQVTSDLISTLLTRSATSTSGASGFDLQLIDTDAWKPAKLNEVLSQISDRGYFMLNRTLIPPDRVERASHRFGLRIGTTTHEIRGNETEFETIFRGLDSALAYSGHIRLLIQASPKTLKFLGPWLKTLRKRGVAILRLSEVVR